MKVTLIDRWSNEIDNPSQSALDRAIDDVFLNNTLPEVSVCVDGIHLDVHKNMGVYLEYDSGDMYYIKDLDVKKIKEIWNEFSKGNIDNILLKPWIKGIPAFNND